MYPATVHGVGMITKLHFDIFAALKESMTLNLTQRSSKVIDSGTNRKRVYIFILVFNSNLDPIAPFPRYGGLNVEYRHFCLPHSYSKQESCAIAKMTAQCALHMSALKNFGTSWLRPRQLIPTFSWAFVPIDPMNVPTKFEVRSFSRS